MASEESLHQEKRSFAPKKGAKAAGRKHHSKKSRIESLFQSGIKDIAQIASQSEASPSYVATVLQKAGLLESYFDLYTNTSKTMNAYSDYFKGKVGFKNTGLAYKSVKLIDTLYKDFETKRDRVGQHHAMMVALTMFNRARWSNKLTEAGYYRDWLVSTLLNSLKRSSNYDA